MCQEERCEIQLKVETIREKKQLLIQAQSQLREKVRTYTDTLATLRNEEKQLDKTIASAVQQFPLPQRMSYSEMKGFFQQKKEFRDQLIDQIHKQENDLLVLEEKIRGWEQRAREETETINHFSRQLLQFNQEVENQRKMIQNQLSTESWLPTADPLPEETFRKHWEYCRQSLSVLSTQLGKIQGMAESLKTRKEILEKNLVELEISLGSSIDQRRSIARDVQERLELLNGELKKLGWDRKLFEDIKDQQPGGWGEKLNRWEGELGQIEKSLQDFKQQVEELSQELKISPELSAQKAQNEKKELEKIKIGLNDSRRRMGILENEMANIQRKIQEKGTIEQEMVQFGKDRDLHFQLKAALDARGFKNYILACLLKELESEASALLEDLSEGRYSLKVRMNRGNTEIIITDSRYGWQERLPGECSGGEKTLIALSLALALSRIRLREAGASPRIDCLFIDEGFSPLDRDHLELVADAILRLGRDGRMVGVVTHDLLFASLFPVHLVVHEGGVTWKKNVDVQ